jgi:hypothetical protein
MMMGFMYIDGRNGATRALNNNTVGVAGVGSTDPHNQGVDEGEGC